MVHPSEEYAAFIDGIKTGGAGHDQVQAQKQLIEFEE
jgi:hypothetical protein